MKKKKKSSLALLLLPMLKIEVFNALQTQFGPSKYTSLKTTVSNVIPN
jgi:hypothetical protein